MKVRLILLFTQVVIWCVSGIVSASVDVGIHFTLRVPQGEIWGVVKTIDAKSTITGVVVKVEGRWQGTTDEDGWYRITGLNVDEVYRVVASAETLDGELSSVYQEVSPGSLFLTNFTLAVDWKDLGAIEGLVAVSDVGWDKEGMVLAGSNPKLHTGPLMVELWREGKCLLSKECNEQGSFEIRNLLCGWYTLKVYEGGELIAKKDVVLEKGKRLNLTLHPNEGPYEGCDLRIYNVPNPFNPLVEEEVKDHFGSHRAIWGTLIKYMLPESVDQVDICIYDLSGGLVMEWSSDNNELYTEGRRWYYIEWNGKNEDNEMVSSGVYICVIRAGGDVASCKIAVVK